MNTKIHYLYADAANCKREWALIVEGEITWADVQPHLDEGEYFIPHEVGLRDLQQDFSKKGDDSVWHRLGADDFVPTTDTPTVETPTAAQLKATFAKIGGKWDEAGAMERLGLE